MLDIKKTMEEGKLTVTLEGRLDTTTARELEESIKPELAEAHSVIFDAAKLQYISSAGLRVLLATQKTVNGRGEMVIRNVTNEVREIFEVTGFTEILTLE
ncbi:MAG: STAS domain-containing protein [Lachnospiraceae bacterium]|nr:STAS domain-containing protein [Lachnospiraceae bacterium]